MKNGNHTLVLLDIKADQPDKEPVVKKKQKKIVWNKDLDKFN